MSESPEVLQFTLFPAVKKQIETIAEASTEEQQQFSVPVRTMLGAVIGRALI